MGRSCTLSEVESFIRADIAGHVLTYFIADNVSGYDGLDKCLHERRSPQLCAVITQIRKLANAGQIDLVQVRDGRRTKYRAVWRERVCPLPPEARLPVPV